MKITVFCEILGEENNGTTIASMNLINYLIKKGHEVTVVCPDDDKKNKKGYVILPKLHLGSFIDKIIAANKVVPSKFDKELVYNAMKDADIDDNMLALKSMEALEKVAQGKSTKLVLPSDAVNFLGTFKGIKEVMKDDDDIKININNKEESQE